MDKATGVKKYKYLLWGFLGVVALLIYIHYSLGNTFWIFKHEAVNKVKNEDSKSNPQESEKQLKWKVYKDDENKDVYFRYPLGSKVEKTKANTKEVWSLNISAADYEVRVTFEKNTVAPFAVEHTNSDYCVLAGNDFWGIVRFLENESANERYYVYGYKYNGYYLYRIFKPKDINITAYVKGPNFNKAEKILAEVIKSFIRYNYPTMRILDPPMAARVIMGRRDNKGSLGIFIRYQPATCDGNSDLEELNPRADVSIPSEYDLYNVTISPLGNTLLVSYCGSKGCRVYMFDIKKRAFFACGKYKYFAVSSKPFIGWDNSTTFFILQDDGISYQECDVRTHQPFYEDHKYATENNPWN